MVRVAFGLRSTNGPIGFEPALCDEGGVIIGRKGAYEVIPHQNHFYVIDTAFVESQEDWRYLNKWAYYNLLTYDINSMDSGSAIPSTWD